MEKPGDFEVTYLCTNKACGNQQTIRFFSSEGHLPLTCCTKCRSGFGMELRVQAENKVGMFPITRTEVR